MTDWFHEIEGVIPDIQAGQGPRRGYERQEEPVDQPVVTVPTRRAPGILAGAEAACATVSAR